MLPAATPRETVWTDDVTRLVRFRAARGAQTPVRGARPVVLLVGSLIERWLLFDVAPAGAWFPFGAPRASLAGALVAADLDVFALDWGPIQTTHRDRGFGWPDAVAAIGRARDAALAISGRSAGAVVGYSQGATFAVIDAALHPERLTALVNIGGPVDFSAPGLAALLTDARWCDADAIAAFGGPPALPFMVRLPAETFRGWVKDFYQRNALVAGGLRVGDRAVDLSRITAPLLTVLPAHDAVCPPASALALAERVGSEVRDTLRVPGGHISCVTGPAACDTLHPALARWLHAMAARAASRTPPPRGAAP
ncbi:MAG: hypothetical protein CVU56_15195 [Deltaproteobacteria bacterium HGW-Deltaproteobacteria-14]|nr:MAG: hypothetical protein CVU56_15195 [Deltaproteobacteria bacterium HGW-Deltaproteobacteria-14]